LKPRKAAIFAATTNPRSLRTLRATQKSEIARRTEIAGNTEWNEPENRLKRAADQFIVKREDGLHTVLAGYHWFTDWGRDTMIALPGLCLTTGRFEVAASILRSFAGAMSQGMIPNRFPEAGETPDFNTVDGTLWFFHAVATYGATSGDWDTVRELYPKLCEGLECHLAGTRFGICADPEDGLLRAGDANSQLTWMDAKIGDTAFTPRSGKPVEIQALWHNALCEMVAIARRFGDENTAGIALEWSRRAEANFADKFWNEEQGCLFDCIDGDFRDATIRPNQIFVVSLPNRLLSSAQEESIVAVVQRELLTPHGLRSLSPRDSRYRGTYSGDSWARDSAYHQGTVWGWPIGGFLSAYLKVHGSSDAAKAQVREWLKPLIAHLDEAGIGSISEIFDGDAPHAPRGCIAQAWSVSEVLRLWEESK
jgi:predicted glycogen debranching enzyme